MKRLAGKPSRTLTMSQKCKVVHTMGLKPSLQSLLLMLARKVQEGPCLTLGSTCRYDGQTFVKPPEVLTRDRLLGTYEVKPTLARLKATLLGTGSSLLFSAVLLLGLINSQADADGMIGVHLCMHCCTASDACKATSYARFSQPAHVIIVLCS